MVKLSFSVWFRRSMRNKEYPKKVGLGEYDGDAGVDGELSGCKFHGTLAGVGTTSRWYFDEIWFYIECETIYGLIETARAIEKVLRDKGLDFSVSYYELELKIPVILPVNILVNDNSSQYELIGDNLVIRYKKLEDFEAIKK